MKPAISPKHRYPSGEIVKSARTQKAETPEQIYALALRNRAKRGATVDNYLDQRWSDPLGMLGLWGTTAFPEKDGLNSQQFDALKLYCAGRGRARWAEGFTAEIRAPRCVMFDGGLIGRSTSGEPELEVVEALKSRHNAANSALYEYKARGIAWQKLLGKLAESEHNTKEDEPYWESVLNEIRSAANVLARHYGIMR